jgi:hypothetical protein
VCQYKITVVPSGCGHIWNDAHTIDCGNSKSGGGVCSLTVAAGTSITLHGTPNYWYTTSSQWWSGGGCSSYGDCTFTPTANTTLTRGFDTVTWDPTFDTATGQGTFTNGNLTATAGTGATTTTRMQPTGDFMNAFTAAGATGGKYYWEVYVNSGGSTTSNVGGLGIIDNSAVSTSYAGSSNYGLSFGYGQVSSTYVYVYTDWTNGAFPGSLTYHDGTTYQTAMSSSDWLGAGDYWMFALDVQNGRLWIGWDGAWRSNGSPAAGTSPTVSGIPTTEFISPTATLYSGGAMSVTANFGCTPFSYGPPAGW